MARARSDDEHDGDDVHDDEHVVPNPLSPPRPFFLASTARSSFDDRSSLDLTDSDRDQPRRVPASPAHSVRALPAHQPRKDSRAHRRRSSHLASYAALDADNPPDADSPNSALSNPFASPVADAWSPAALYSSAASAVLADTRDPHNRSPPPSSYALYPDNAGDLASRRSSADSSMPYRLSFGGPPASLNGPYQAVPRSATASDAPLSRPYPAFIAEETRSLGGESGISNSQFYARGMSGNMHAASSSDLPLPIPRAGSVFRAPFLSPASRPTSSLWAPPAYPAYPGSPNASTTMLAVQKKSTRPSTRLAEKLSANEKPWLTKKDSLERWSWWLTLLGIVLGFGGAAYLCYSGWTSVLLLPDSDLCLMLDDDFDTFDTSNWNYDVEASGFGNGEFEMTTDSSNNSYVSNSNLYIVPTLSSTVLGQDAIFDGGNYTLPGCTVSSTNASACSVSSNAQTGAVIPPIMSARINTAGKQTIKFGRVEVRAKLPSGDWLWPAIWMLPENSVYGAWPLSGEIDIMEARGNGPTYPAQGSNYVRSSLNFGPLASLYTMLYGWYSVKQGSFADGFHVYSMEWTGEWMRFYTDSQLQAMLTVKMGSGTNDGSGSWFWQKGDYPATAYNDTSGGDVVVQDPWNNGSWAAPFDQNFYMVLDLAAGGTSGWFPDDEGGKPWYDASLTAMSDFANAQDQWYPTWATDVDDLAFRIDYVKMWQLCPNGAPSSKRRRR